ncbi:S8 family serine peptidase [Actinomycetes bacterium KLBMP 9797]
MTPLARGVAAVVAGALTVTAVGVPAPSHATPAVPPAATAVTLITGDVVQLAAAGAGRYAATVRPAPGREHVTFHTLEVEGGLRVLPSDAIPRVSSGVLDADLFDVQELIADGYTDRLPLIVRYAGGSARTLAGATGVRELPSIGGAAFAVERDARDPIWGAPARAPAARPGRDFWRSAASARSAGIERIWLDGRVRPVLDRSVAQIGAPAVWRSGYDGSGVDVAVLDTGVDPAHPDLLDKVAASANFTDSADATDHFGHGTHVAATVAGTGTASGGLRKGVAPGADILNGKVLNDAGSGYDSWIIAGMEWAVASGAEVVNMSLGGDPTDGTDPLSEAVNRLTAESGTLFVVSAGNKGLDASIGTPGAADAALTVGAVDRNEGLATFSSRGPRLGDLAVKPEITAPGVDIVAARAAGTTMGTPVDANYTTASGTSMAAPHVAGAAALLAQANPEWSAPRLKDALVSTAVRNPQLDVFAQGGGRVDAVRAVTQHVYATAVREFGVHTVPAAPVTHPVAYTNASAAPVTLTLSGPAGFRPGSSTVTVPAGQTVSVPVTADFAALGRGQHTGWLTATGPGGVSVRTVLSATLDGPKHTVTFRAVDRSGAPVSVPVVMLHGEDRRSDTLGWFPTGGSFSVEVEEGPYLLHALIEDGAPLDEQATLITNPELMVNRDLVVLLDARTGTPIRVETPKPAEARGILSYYVRRVHGNGRAVSHGVMHYTTVEQVNVTPTKRPSTGTYEFSSRWQLMAPMVRATVSGLAGPFDINLLHQSPGYDGTRVLPLTIGAVRGAAALIEASDVLAEEEQVAAAAAAGAAVAIIVRPADWSAWTVWRPIGDRLPIPAMVVAHDDGQRLLARARRGAATLHLTLTVSSPYLYDVFHVERGRVPDRIVHRMTDANSARITTRYGDQGGFGWAKEQRFGWRPWQTYSWNDTQRFMATPTQREEWVSAGDSVWQHRVHYAYTWDEMNPLSGGAIERPRGYRGGTHATEEWYTPVIRPVGDGSARAGDTLSLWVPEFVSDGHAETADSEEVSARLWRDGALIATLPDARQEVPVPAARSAYRLAVTTARASEEWQWSTRTETVWDFRSARPSGTAPRPLPLLRLDYDTPADLSGRVSGRHAHTVGIAVRHQAGLAAPRDVTVRAEVSFDEGRTWRPARVTGSGAEVRATVPAGTGSVSLRVSARDAAGNAITQTVIRAYGFR